MNNFAFSEDQLNYIYSHKKFLIFLSSYFTNNNKVDFDINLDMSNNENIEYWSIYIRILLANLRDLVTTLEKIESNISFLYNEEFENVSGRIKGRLLVNEYVRNKNLVKIPKEYPCKIKKKSYYTIENEYLIYIIFHVQFRLLNINKIFIDNLGYKAQISELKLLNSYIDYFQSFAYKHPFKLIFTKFMFKNNNDSYSNSKKNIIDVKLSKGKIRNGHAYKNVFEWFDKFSNNGFTWISSANLKYLIYDNEFCNKLFEIWNLYRIVETLQVSFNMKIIEKNDFRNGMNNYIFKMQDYKKRTIEVYFQVGKNLYWNKETPQNWYYLNNKSKKYLIGVPDISVKFLDNNEDIVLIDIKNKNRSTGDNSDEIYKIIGYFSNFGEFLRRKYKQNNCKKAILVFRNDIKQFEENVENEMGDRILSISTGINEDLIVNDYQFIKICRFILSNK